MSVYTGHQPDESDGQTNDDLDYLWSETRDLAYGDGEADVDVDEILEILRGYSERALVLEKIMAWHERMQLQGEGIAHNLDRMEWMIKNPDKEYEDFDKEYDEE